MSDEVEVEFGEKPDETATLLLAAAEELDLPADVVRTGSGVFIVPEEVQEKAGVDKKDDESEDSDDGPEGWPESQSEGKSEDQPEQAKQEQAQPKDDGKKKGK